MSKTRDTGFLGNVIKVDTSGNVSFVSGSTTLATLNTSGQLSGSSPVLSSSYALNADLLDGLDSTQFTLTSSFAAQTASFTAFTSSVNSFTASQNILNGTYATTGSNTFAGIQTINSNLVVTGSITAQTLVVSTINVTQSFSSGSNIFGNSQANTQTFTGSVNITGSLTVVTTGTEFQVNASGVNLGNTLTDSHVISGSLRVNPNGLFVSGSGLVGIGTTTPEGVLTINGTAAQPPTSGTTANSLLQLVGTGNVQLNMGCNTVAGGYGSYIQASDNNLAVPYQLNLQPNGGNVLIGGYTDNGGKLQVYSTTSSVALKITTSYASGRVANFGFGDGSVLPTAAFYIGNQTAVGVYIGDETSATKGLYITAAGLVGIGTTSPASPGGFAKNVTLYDTSSVSYSFNVGNTYTGEVGISSNGGYLGTNTNHNFRFATNNTERLIIYANGRIGNLNAPANDFALTLTASSTTGQSYGLNVYGGTNSSDDTITFRSYSGTVYFKVRGDGQVNTGAYTYANAVGTPRTLYVDSAGTIGGISSILASKTNIKQFNTNWLYDLKPVQFNYRKKDENEEFTDEFNTELFYGLIAEETELINKEICTYNEDKLIGIEYSKLVPVLVKAIQEQQAQINELKAQING